MLARSLSCENIRRFDQKYQPNEMTLPVSILMIKYLVVVSLELWMV